MLVGLHVKNLALIEQADVEFGNGLNILTGETGAGKSIIIGSVALALGAKASRDMIRCGEEYAYIELIFSVDDEKKREELKKTDVYPDEDGLLIISKKITQCGPVQFHSRCVPADPRDLYNILLQNSETSDGFCHRIPTLFRKLHGSSVCRFNLIQICFPGLFY